jgi:hypothetical protein
MNEQDNAAAVLPLFEAEELNASIRGRDAADANTDPAWADGVLSAIQEMARTGRPFQAFDLVREFDLTEPEKPCQWGPIFARAHRDGVIVRVGAAPSHRRTVSKSLTSVWRGAPDWITTDTAAAA